MLARTMMLPNSSGVVRRPCVVNDIDCCCASMTGAPPIRPTAACTFCARTASITSCGVSPNAGQPLQIQPDPHGVVLRAEWRDLAHPWQAGQSVADVDGDVVRQEQAVIGALGRLQRDDLEDGGGRRFDLHAALLHLGGQARHARAARGSAR